MGLFEQIKDGAVLKRENVSFIASAGGTGTVPLGSVYALLSIQTTVPCRFRLYDKQSSRDDATEQSRVFGDTNIPDSIALVTDISMSTAGTYTIDPILYGVSDDLTNRLSYYRINPTGITPTITLTRFLLDDRNIVPNIQNSYDVDNRRNLPAISAVLAYNQLDSGSISNSQIPTTYILVSASLTNSGQIARLRLYNQSSSINNTSEKTRPFATEPSASVGLIVDAILNSGVTTHFVPKIIGSNIENIGTNLQLAKANSDLISGEKKLYYILENVEPSSPSETIEVKLNVYSLEE